MRAGAWLFVAGAAALLGAGAAAGATPGVGGGRSEVVAPTVTNFSDFEVTFNATVAEDWTGAGNLSVSANGTASANNTAPGLPELGDRRLLTAEQDAQSHTEVPIAEFDFSAGMQGVATGSGSLGPKAGLVAGVAGGALLMLPLLI